MSEMVKHENKIKDEMIDYKTENEHVKILKKVGFHAGYSLGFGFEPILMKRFDLP